MPHSTNYTTVPLTLHQRKIVRLHDQGYSREELLRALAISEATLKWHVTRIRRHLPEFLRPVSFHQGHVRLTTRELQIARLIAAGFHDQAIAHALQIARRTVRFHLENLFAKTATQCRTDMATTLILKNQIAICVSDGEAA
jgi:DNA-binding CsgD family transcriptional regulator